MAPHQAAAAEDDELEAAPRGGESKVGAGEVRKRRSQEVCAAGGSSSASQLALALHNQSGAAARSLIPKLQVDRATGGRDSAPSRDRRALGIKRSLSLLALRSMRALSLAAGATCERLPAAKPSRAAPRKRQLSLVSLDFESPIEVEPSAERPRPRSSMSLGPPEASKQRRAPRVGTRAPDANPISDDSGDNEAGDQIERPAAVAAGADSLECADQQSDQPTCLAVNKQISLRNSNSNSNNNDDDDDDLLVRSPCAAADSGDYVRSSEQVRRDKEKQQQAAGKTNLAKFNENQMAKSTAGRNKNKIITRAKPPQANGGTRLSASADSDTLNANAGNKQRQPVKSSAAGQQALKKEANRRPATEAAESAMASTSKSKLGRTNPREKFWKPVR